MLDAIFRLFFNYRPVVFQQGEFRLLPTTGSYVAAAVVVAAIVITILTYRSARARSDARHRAVLTAIRVAMLALVLFCLFRPVLVVKAAVPQQNFLGVLVDDSRSMQIADVNGGPRSAFVQKQLAGPEAATMQALGSRFVLRNFRFSSTAQRLGAPSDLTFSGAQTKLGAALDGARQELAGLPLAGLVVISDGADTTDAELTEALLAMKAADVPVFTLGLGRESLEKDVQIDRVSVPPAALKGTSLMVDALVTQTGYAGESVTLDVEDAGRIVGSQELKLPIDGQPATVRVRFTAADSGPRVFRFRIASRVGEQVTQNNQREALVDVYDRTEKILYFEGEPRPEQSFLHRAVDEDKNLQVVTIVRTADNKYYRLLLDNADQLAGGFPKTRDELFAYRGLILGSIEAGAFTGDQLRMIAEFVERRGGGLLMLGGGRSFSEGGYAGTPVADALPVELERMARQAQWSISRLKIRPTRAGEGHALAQIAPTEAASLNRWNELPTLISANTIKGVKPGATVLLTGADEGRGTQPVLSFQRYGRGKALAFTVLDSWRWQMHASIPLEDMTHENIWRQLLRWLVDGVPGPVEVHTTVERVEAGEPVTVLADVVDDTFLEINDAQVTAKVTTPNGAAIDVPMQWTGERNGQYRGTFVTTDEGMYARARRGDARQQAARRRRDPRARRARRRRVLRRDDARGAAAAYRGRDRRQVLYAGDAAGPGRGPEVHRPRRDHGRGT